MFLLKITKKLVFSRSVTVYNYPKYLLCLINVLKFVKKETFSYYVRWFFFFIFTNLYNLNMKAKYLISSLYFSFFNNKKLINYVISIDVFSTNTFVSINNIKGNPKFFYSAGMFKLQKTQKVRQPKATITILRAFLTKAKLFKTKPVAIHFKNFFFNHQSYIFKRLKQKVFAKLMTGYICRSHNGCRLKKKKRIKIRTRTKKLSKK